MGNQPVALKTTSNSPLHISNSNASIDIREKALQFKGEFKRLLSEYHELTSNPYSNATMTVAGEEYTSKDISSPAFTLALDSYLAELDDQQYTLLQIWKELFNLEKQAGNIQSQ